MTEKILDFKSRFEVPGLTVHDFVLGHFVQALADPAMIGVILGDYQNPLNVFVKAHINAAPLPGRFGWQGRWISKCLDLDCMGAEYVDPGEPIFMCVSCWNRAHDWQWLRVRFPVAKAAIENILLRRPARNRNWDIGQTVAELQAENLAHGLEI